MRVDLLTPALHRVQKPVRIARFAAAAQPLPYLDYLIEEPQPGAIIGGAGVLVNVPLPARFALHKLIVARSRPTSMQTKSTKDLDQAASILAALAEDRHPGDLRLAWSALRKRGWDKTLTAGLGALRRRHPDAHRMLEHAIR